MSFLSDFGQNKGLCSGLQMVGRVALLDIAQSDRTLAWERVLNILIQMWGEQMTHRPVILHRRWIGLHSSLAYLILL